MAQPVLYISGEALEMGGLPAITIERHNPLLSEGQQSYSYPFTLPRTPHNDRLLNFPARYARAARAQHSWTCTLVCGARMRVGKLALNSIEASSYDCSMIYDTAELLAKTKGKKLGELTGWKVIPYGNAQAAVQEMQLFSAHAQLRHPELYEEAAIFPVALQSEVGKYTYWNGQETVTVDRAVLFMLNRLFVWEPEESGEVEPSDNGAMLVQSEDVIGGEWTGDVPYGMGIAPFLRVSTILKFIFEKKEGYTLDWGSRAENPILQLVVLHNRMDALVTGMLQYKHLLPECTVEDFVSTIEGMFCGKFMVNSKTKTVNFKFFNDELDYQNARPTPPSPYPPYPNTRVGNRYKEPKLELMPYITQQPKVEFRAKSTLKLSAKKNAKSVYEGASSPSNGDVSTVDEFFTQDIENAYPTSFQPYPEGKCENLVQGEIYDSGTTSNAFGYYRGVEGGASVDVALAYEMLMTSEFDVGAAPNSGMHIVWTTMYTFGRTYVNTGVVGSKKEDKENTTPLAFACAAEVTYMTEGRSLYRTFGATQGNYYQKIGSYSEHDIISLRLHRPDGLFNVYHSLRDRMLRSGGYKLTVRIDSSLVVNENEQYTLNGQKVLVESVTETLGEHPSQEVVLQTIKDYEEDGSIA